VEDFFSGLQAPHSHHVTDDTIRVQVKKEMEATLLT